MENTLIFIGSFIITFWIVWFVIRQREKQREKRFREYTQWIGNRKKEHEEVAKKMRDYFKEEDNHFRDSTQYALKAHQYQNTNKENKRNIPSVPASDRINLDDSYMYQQQPFVATDDYKPFENHSSGFDHGFGGGDFSGGGSGGSWNDSHSSSYDSRSSSDTNFSNDQL